MSRTLLAFVNNEPEVLMRVTGLLRRKGLDIKHISMGESKTPAVAYLVTTLTGENQDINQAIHQMNKLIDVYRVDEIAYGFNAEQFWALADENLTAMGPM
ncbi:acetolactate synthase-1/3 small subunit [Anaerosolibacter carboniphilus]|uniref:Acetolactate synthase small subunit n=1 Tax=Anaerosolibacter carboniphilus TaxID=1417629 RepID=A0A841KT06_9FIRM|nr:acetolactate synthase small subunit [Anaerosolibacter carboniphilus]MBB6215288.1 acetolactate synthase-1/3 small subunit [Anaerosolibacter carboniphilus]